MKKTLILLSILIICATPKITSANPSILPIISEVFFDDSDNWTIELCNKLFTNFENLDGLRIVTSTDTAIIKKGVEFKGNCILLTNADLEKPIKLIRNGDCLHFESKFNGDVWYFAYFTTFMWGKLNSEKQFSFYSDLILNYPHIAPQKGQSLCAIICNRFHNPLAAQASQDIVISSKPTLGYDFFNATSNCSISGIVKDKNNMPVKNAWICIALTQKVDFLLPVQTDSTGNFSIKNLFIKEYDLSVNIPGNLDKKSSIFKNGVFNKLYNQKILFKNDSNVYLKINLNTGLQQQNYFKNDLNFEVKVISDSTVRFSIDTINKDNIYHDEIEIFIANKDGKIIYYEDLHSGYPPSWNNIFVWNIHDRKIIERESAHDLIKEYRSYKNENSNEYYCAVTKNFYGEGAVITYIQKFKIGK
ncbi:MAG: carboxypeptidase regulatory-like domain-containing protein [Bacteroidetes bacterium]|nr:carboxypeptidase regulatory-like domain-containing protein [Bacteroidota bacterium]